jgi:hypothetical protein
METKLFKDFITFSRLQLRTWDVDPSYPLLKRLYYYHYDYEEDIALWHTFVYVAFYHLGSAETFLRYYPHPTSSIRWVTTLPTGVERRGFRGRPDLIQEHLKDLYRKLFPFTKRIKDTISRYRDAWSTIREDYQSVSYAGPWSSYKLVDLLKWVHGYEITSPDFGVGGGGKKAGPIPGLAAITGYDWKDCATKIEMQQWFYNICQRQMEPQFGGMDQCETCLCDFNSLMHGRYYVGHDIDQQLEFLTSQGLTRPYMEIRKEIFPDCVLGENHDWREVRKKLKSLYSVYGEIYDPFSGTQPSRNKRQR